MKKMMNWVLAAILICCASVFTSCTNDTSDNPVPAPGKNRQGGCGGNTKGDRQSDICHRGPDRDAHRHQGLQVPQSRGA